MLTLRHRHARAQFSNLCRRYVEQKLTSHRASLHHPIYAFHDPIYANARFVIALLTPNFILSNN